jgi:predicted enzyme related to lactoylglutathione lyase
VTLLAGYLPAEEASAQQDPANIPSNIVLWHGLLTTDADAAEAFYSGLFGWETERAAPGRYLISHDGALIGGISEIQPQDPDVNGSTWLLGISVPDTRASVDRARRAGATVFVDMERAEGIGDWAVIEDPQAAQVLLFTPEIPVGGKKGAGHWAWAELWTQDLEASFDFYAATVGWEGGTWDRPDGEYPVFLSDGEPRAGLVPIEGGEWEPGWAPYVGVADLSATIEQAEALGGQILFQPDPEVDAGLIAGLIDPTGVGFLIYQLPENQR